MDDKELELEIKDQIEIRNNFWIAVLGASGGIASLIMFPDSFAKWTLISLGFMLIIMFANGYFSRIGIIKTLINKHKRRQLK